jgi:hypothetical protein
MAISGDVMRDNRDALRELAMQQCITAIRDSGEFLTADNLAKFLLVDSNKLRKQLTDWKGRGEIFSVQDAAEGELFPVFAFDNSHGLQLFEAIPRVLEVFRDRLSAWGIAGWFVAASSYLDDQLPKDLLREDPDWVVEAALDWMGEVSHG